MFIPSFNPKEVIHSTLVPSSKAFTFHLMSVISLPVSKFLIIVSSTTIEVPIGI
jgi:hypothetical protein